MNSRMYSLCSFLLLWWISIGTAQVVGAHHQLVVGTKEAPPFSMKSADGSWTGISIELWKDLAAELKLDYEFKELDLEHLLSGVTNGSLNAAVAAITVTSDRERVMDFTHPFYTTGLGIAVPERRGAAWMVVLRRVLSPEFLTVVGFLALILMGVGFLIWLFERRQNAEHFGGSSLQGIGSGFWWSAVTMTTVGYGDKAPQTLGGRLVGLVWMFAAIIIISSFTAAIASALTVGELGSPIHGPADLPSYLVGTVESSTGEQYLKRRQVDYQSYPDADEALQALAAGKVEAVVYDAPILKYLVKQKFRRQISILPSRFVRQDYAIAVPQGSPMREQLDRVLEKEIRSPRWGELTYEYLGSEEE